jgi:hypothetical protein
MGEMGVHSVGGARVCRAVRCDGLCRQAPGGLPTVTTDQTDSRRSRSDTRASGQVAEWRGALLSGHRGGGVSSLVFNGARVVQRDMHAECGARATRRAPTTIFRNGIRAGGAGQRKSVGGALRRAGRTGRVSVQSEVVRCCRMVQLWKGCVVEGGEGAGATTSNVPQALWDEASQDEKQRGTIFWLSWGLRGRRRMRVGGRP